MIKLIAAVSANGIIGTTDFNGKPTIPWSYREDMKFFKEKTSNSIVVMGRKTFESIGRPLPNRKNIVISTTIKSDDPFAFEVVSNFNSVFDCIKEDDNRDIWVIGGSQVYEDAMEFADEIYLTLVPQFIDPAKYENVARFPWINPTKFKLSVVHEQISDALTVIKYIKI